MATNKNFEVKNGLTVAGTERISSAGAFTGSLASATTATTQSATDNSTKIATTAYTDAAITALVDSSPGTLNTLNELAAALGDNANFSTTVTNSIATKLPLAGGTMTGDITSNESTFSIFNNDFRLKTSAAETMLRAVGNGAVEIMHDNSTKLATTSSGVTVTGTLTSTGLNSTSGTVEFADGSSAFDSSNSNGYPVFSHTNGSAQIGFARAGGSTGIGYIGADSTYNLAVFNSSFSKTMVLTQTGKVGIGTASPATQLQLLNTGESMIRMGYSTTQYAQIGRNSDGTYEFSCYENGGVLKFGTSQSNNATTERMRITATGKVGIGTASPAADLHVTGSNDGNLTSAIFANTSTGGTNDRVGIEFQLAGTSGQVAAGTIRAGKSEDWSSGTSRSGFLSLEAVLDGTNREMMYLGSDGDGSSIVRFSTANIERMRLEANGILSLGNTQNRRPFAVQGSMGYSASYKTTIIGSTSTSHNTDITGATSLAFNYDPSGNPNGSFAGTGQEIWFRRSTNFKTPNSANNAFYTQFTMTDGVTSGDFIDTSDRNLKENITSITNGYDVIKDLNPVTFNWKDPGKGNGLGGFIAQEVETVLPNDVFGEDYTEGDRGQPLTDGKAINTTSIVAHLVKAVQELEARIKELEG